MPSMDHEAAEQTVAGPSSQIVRLWLVPIVTSVLFVGGVYWLRQLPAGTRSREQAANVQVQLVRAPDPTRIPVQAVPAPVAPDAGQRAELPVADPPRVPSEDTAVTPPLRTPARAERSPAPSVRPLPTAVRSFPSNVALTFQRTLERHIERYKVVPSEARRARLQGIVQLVFAMGRDGTVLDVWINSSSGYPVLDQAALDIVRRAQPLPRIPAELPDRLNILYPVSFSLS
jgi:periplasmic protein TonB